MANPEKTRPPSGWSRFFKVFVELSSAATVVSFVFAALILLIVLETHRIPFGSVVGVNDIVTFGIGVFVRALWFTLIMMPALLLTAAVTFILAELVRLIPAVNRRPVAPLGRILFWVVVLLVYILCIPLAVDPYYAVGDDLIGMPPPSASQGVFLSLRCLIGICGYFYAYLLALIAIGGAFLFGVYNNERVSGQVVPAAGEKDGIVARGSSGLLILIISLLGSFLLTTVIAYQKIDYELSVGIGWLEKDELTRFENVEDTSAGVVDRKDKSESAEQAAVRDGILVESCAGITFPTVHWVGSEAILARCGSRFIVARSPENIRVILRGSPVSYGARDREARGPRPH